jgi:hypothetical protein
MKFHPKASGAMTIVELMITTILVSALGLVIYSLLNIGMILGAKNLAVNVAHEEARMAMLQMIQDFHSSVSLPAVANSDGSTSPVPTPGPSPLYGYPGIAFQLWSIGPLRIAAKADPGQNIVQVTVPAGTQVPVAGQRLIVRTHQLEDDITAVSGAAGGPVNLTLAHNVPVTIDASSIDATKHIVCFITDRCSYAIANKTLTWNGPGTRKAVSLMANTMTNPTPFTIKLNNSGTPYAQFIAAFDLSTANANYTNRGFKSANILLRSEVPMRVRLTDTQ